MGKRLIRSSNRPKERLRSRRFLLSGQTSLASHVPPVGDSAAVEGYWPVGTRVPYQSGARHFQVEDVFKGGMGTVYIVTDMDSGEPFVVKTVRDHLAGHPELVARFWREVEAWITLEKHPNIVQARGFEQLDGRPHLLLEYVSGGSLREFLGHEDLPVPDILVLAVQVARGMRHAASKGINAHRDLKPDNILLTAERVAKITDFGLVKLYTAQEGNAPWLNADESAASQFLTFVGGRGMGTTDYMPPEQWRDAGVADIRSDIYSFGVMLYEMLIRIRPFYGRNRRELYERHLTHVPVQPSALRPDVPLAVDALVARCIEKHPEDRYQSFAEVEQELTRILQKDFRRVVRLLTTDQLSVAELNERGAAFFNLGKPHEALESFDAALQLDRMHALAWANRGVALAELERFQEALASFDRALRLEPASPIVLMNKGLTLLELSQEEDAHLCLDRATQLNPLLEEAWRYHAELLNRLSWYETAYYSAYKARQLNPEDERAWYQEALALYRMGRFEHAAEAVDRCVQRITSRDPAILLLRSQIAFAMGEVRQALLLTAAVTPDAPEYREALLLGMDCALHLGRLDEIASHRDALVGIEMAGTALELLLDALGTDYEHARLELLVITCETAVFTGDFEVALRAFEAWQARTQDRTRRIVPRIRVAMLRKHTPASPQQRVALGILLSHLDKPHMAARHLRRGLALLPGALAGWQAFARVSTALGEYRDAEFAARQGTLLAPSIPENWLTWAEAALRSGDYAQALDGAQTYHTQGRETAISLFVQGAALAGLERWTAAIRLFERALALDPQLSVAWWNQCLCLMRAKRFEEARRAMLRARALDSRMWERAPYDPPPFVPYPLPATGYLTPSV